MDDATRRVTVVGGTRSNARAEAAEPRANVVVGIVRDRPGISTTDLLEAVRDVRSIGQKAAHAAVKAARRLGQVASKSTAAHTATTSPPPRSRTSPGAAHEHPSRYSLLRITRRYW